MDQLHFHLYTDPVPPLPLDNSLILSLEFIKGKIQYNKIWFGKCQQLLKLHWQSCWKLSFIFLILLLSLLLTLSTPASSISEGSASVVSVVMSCHKINKYWLIDWSVWFDVCHRLCWSTDRLLHYFDGYRRLNARICWTTSNILESSGTRFHTCQGWSAGCFHQISQGFCIDLGATLVCQSNPTWYKSDPKSSSSRRLVPTWGDLGKKQPTFDFNLTSYIALCYLSSFIMIPS